MHADIAGLLGGFGPFQRLTDFSHGLVALAIGEIEARAQGPEDQRIATRRDDLFQLGSRRVAALGGFQQAQQVDLWSRLTRRGGGGQFAQIGLGLVVLFLRQIEADQGRLGLGVIRELLDRGAQMRLDRRHVALFDQQGQTLPIAQTVIRLQLHQLRGQLVALAQSLSRAVLSSMIASSSKSSGRVLSNSWAFSASLLRASSSLAVTASR